MVDNSSVIVQERHTKSNMRQPVIYFDSEHYFLMKRTLDFIFTDSLLDIKSLLAVKQELLSEGFLKIYKSAYQTELEIDFTVVGGDGEKKRLSGIAIKRHFFDTFGGITLYERGGN